MVPGGASRRLRISPHQNRPITRNSLGERRTSGEAEVNESYVDLSTIIISNQNFGVMTPSDDIHVFFL